ncbi:hypothetical protein [Streptomyces sp. MB09-02B]|uniref:hypothetical protein n=1 Tax=Streptomyces sp. MB09-02B TaxID=3028667 RepID=UPI0029A4C2D5|nr:hypothetical protein [Streptomyces sp. MB09-02B]MDX3644528.1 hypothetical protein [Streptomyces sp. MB09-02B]
MKRTQCRYSSYGNTFQHDYAYAYDYDHDHDRDDDRDHDHDYDHDVTGAVGGARVTYDQTYEE